MNKNVLVAVVAAIAITAFLLVSQPWEVVPAQPMTPNSPQTVAEKVFAQGQGARVEVDTAEKDAANFEATGPSVVLRGLVSGPEGAPVGGATVFVGRSRRVNGQWAEPATAQVKTNALGHFELSCRGTRLLLTASKADLASKFVVEVHVRGRMQIDGIEIGLAPTGFAEGQLVDADRRPIADHVVRARSSHGGNQNTGSVPGVFANSAVEHLVRTDARGLFRLRVVLDHTYSWIVQHPNYPELTGYYGAADSLFVLRFDSGGVVTGRVLRADGQPADGARVELNDQPPRVAFCSPQGTFRLSGVGLRAEPAETDSVTAVTSAVRVGQTNHRVNSPYLKIEDDASAIHVVPLDGAQTGLEIRLERPKTIAGRVIDTLGQPVADSAVSILGDRVFDPGFSDGKAWTWERCHGCDDTVTRSDGTFAFKRLYAGEFAISVRPHLHPGTPFRRRVLAGAGNIEFKVDLGHVGGATLAGRIRDALTKQPIRQFWVSPWYEGADRALGQSIVTTDGSFRIDGLEPGRIRLQFRSDGYSRRVIPWQDYGAGLHEINIDLLPQRGLDVRLLDSSGAPIPNFRVSAFDQLGNNLESQIESPGATLQASSVVARDGTAQLRGLPAQRVTVRIQVAGSSSVDRVVDLVSPREEPLIVAFEKAAESVAVEVLVLCAEPEADVSDLKKTFARRESASLRSVMIQAHRRADVWFLEQSVQLDLRSLLENDRASTAKLERVGTKEPRPGMKVPQYSVSVHNYNGSGLNGQSSELPLVRLQHVRQELVLSVVTAGYEQFESRIGADTFVKNSVNNQLQVCVLAVLRKK